MSVFQLLGVRDEGVYDSRTERHIYTEIIELVAEFSSEKAAAQYRDASYLKAALHSKRSYVRRNEISFRKNSLLRRYRKAVIREKDERVPFNPAL